MDWNTSDLEGPRIDRRTTTKLLASAGLLSAAGCTGASESESETTSGDTSEIVAGFNLDEIEFLDPHYVDKGQEITLQSNIYNGLVKIGADGSLVGDLAKNWSIPDSTTYEFDLVEGATFHNGDPVDSTAIKASLERLMSLDDSPHLSKVESIESIETPDPTTLVISLSETVGPFISFMARGPGRAGTIVNASAALEDPDAFNRMPVGSGPFKLVERETGEYLQFEAHEEYHETNSEGVAYPLVDSLRVDLIPEPSTRWTALQSGDINYTNEVPAQSVEQANQTDGIQIAGTNPGAWFCIAPLCNDPAEVDFQQFASGNEEATDKWETEDLPTTDPDVRKAISKAIDRETLVERAHLGNAVPAHSLWNPAIPALHEDQPDPGQYYDLEGAKTLLDAAGYTGEPRMTLSLLGEPSDERRMTVIQQMLSQVGIDVELNVTQSSAYWDSVYRYENELVMYDGYVDIDPWMSVWKQLKTPSEASAGDWQANLYSNPEFNGLLEEDLTTADPDRRVEIMKQAEEIFIQDTAWVMTTFPLIAKGYSSEISDVGNQAGLSNFHYSQME